MCLDDVSEDAPNDVSQTLWGWGVRRRDHVLQSLHKKAGVRLSSAKRSELTANFLLVRHHFSKIEIDASTKSRSKCGKVEMLQCTYLREVNTPTDQPNISYRRIS